MKVLIHEDWAAQIRAATHAHRRGLGPQLCCEVAGAPLSAASAAVTSAIHAWGRDLIACLQWQGSTWRVRFITVDHVPEVLSLATDEQYVVTFIDPVTLGGCSVDYTPGEDDTVEILLTAWGAQEQTATAVDQALEGAGTWRGN
jgi:hypothetical protein